MEFRRLNIKDLDSYFSNRLRALADSPEAFLSTMEETKAQGNGRFKAILSQSDDQNVIFGAVENGTVVGTCGVLLGDRVKTRHKATIWGMYVDRDQRGKSVGAKLIDLAIAHAREKLKVKVIYLSVASANEQARRLYESRGFVRWGVEPFAVLDDSGYSDEDHMSLTFES